MTPLAKKLAITGSVITILTGSITLANVTGFTPVFAAQYERDQNSIHALLLETRISQLNEDIRKAKDPDIKQDLVDRKKRYEDQLKDLLK